MIKLYKYNKRDSESVGILIADTYRKYNLSSIPKEELPAFMGPFDHARSQNKSHQEAIATAISASMVFTAKKDGEFVGVLRGRKDKLQSLFVSGDFHRCGIGSKLVERFESECVKQGADVVKLMSSLYAVRFYQALGYKKSTSVRKMSSFEGEGFEYQPMKKILYASPII